MPDLTTLFKSGIIDATTLIFADDGSLPSWTALLDVPALYAACYEAANPPAPPPAPAPAPPPAPEKKRRSSSAANLIKGLISPRGSFSEKEVSSAASSPRSEPAKSVDASGVPPVPPVISRTKAAGGKRVGANEPTVLKKPASPPTPHVAGMPAKALTKKSLDQLVGKSVWVPDKTGVFKKGQVSEVEENANGNVVTLSTGESVKVELTAPSLCR